jgi:hypothetical protein
LLSDIDERGIARCDLYYGQAGGEAGAMKTRTRTLLDSLIAVVVIGLVAGIYLAASYGIDWRVKAAVDAVQEQRQ